MIYKVVLMVFVYLNSEKRALAKKLQPQHPHQECQSGPDHHKS